MCLQAKGFFEKELENLSSKILAANNNMQLIDSECSALKEETSQAIAAHAAAVKVSLHSTFPVSSAACCLAVHAA